VVEVVVVSASLSDEEHAAAPRASAVRAMAVAAILLRDMMSSCSMGSQSVREIPETGGCRRRMSAAGSSEAGFGDTR